MMVNSGAGAVVHERKSHPSNPYKYANLDTALKAHTHFLLDHNTTMTETSIQEKKQGVEIDQVSMSNRGDISVDCSSMEQGKTVKERIPVISPEEKKLVKKINIAFVPLVCAILFVQVCFCLAVLIVSYMRLILPGSVCR